MGSTLIYKLRQKLTTYGELVMFSHTLFSLPFALMAMMLASNGLPEGRVIFWILVALFAGRNGANALNRYVDATYDAKNPRTQSRHIPAGKVKLKEALYITLFCYMLFVFAAAMLNPLCLWLSPVALMLFTVYSYTKRFTWLCHLVLGVTCAGAPVGAWLAVTGSFDLIPFVLAAVVTLWVAGFDIIYGTQDIAFDRAEGLFSIPARFGLQGALWISRAFHLVMWLLLVSLFFLTPLHTIYLAGVAISGLLLIIEHYMVTPEHQVKMNIASYHINQVISVLLLTVTALDVMAV
jgi:4-hydroxybenzoate polyprenyltransferase